MSISVQIMGLSGSMHDNIVVGTFGSLITGSGMTLTNNLTNGALSFFGFVNPHGYDYHLTGGSPAVNQASTNSFQSVDMDNLSRPQGFKSDVGTHEYY
jgi:hypothetical protein